MEIKHFKMDFLCEHSPSSSGRVNIYYHHLNLCEHSPLSSGLVEDLGFLTFRQPNKQSLMQYFCL